MPEEDEIVSIKVNLRKALRLRFKVLCTQNEINMSDVVSGLIERWVGEHEQPPSSKGK